MLKYDVLIIGSGGSGMRAALEASKNPNLSVAVMTKMMPTRSATCMAQGGINGAVGHADSTDTIDKHMFDTVKGSDYLGDQNAIEYFVSEATKAILELDYWGMAFNRQDDGRLGQRKMAGHTCGRTAFSADKTGHVLLHTVFEQCLKQNVNFLVEWQLLEIVVDANGICGVVAVNMHTGEMVPIMAKTVIVATGGFGRLYWVRTSNPFSSTGDGVAACLNIGIPVKDAEMVQFHPTGMAGSGVLLSEACRGEGGYLINKDGERFMARYAPEKMELGPRDLVSQAIETEIKEGRGVGDGLSAHVYLDLRHLGKEKILDRLPQIRQLVMNFEGVDPIDAPMPIRPSCHYSMGGIDVVDHTTCATKIPGIFAAGECSCISVHGANRLGGNSLAEIMVFGKTAGNGASQAAVNREFAGEDKLNTAVSNWEEKFKKLTARTTGTSVASIRDRMACTMWYKVGVFRDGEKLEQAVKELATLAEEYKTCKIGDTNALFNTAFMNYIELGNMLSLAQAVALAALNRKESRGSHMREDFPERDDKNFLQHSIISKNSDGKYELSYRPVVVTRYKPEERKY